MFSISLKNLFYEWVVSNIVALLFYVESFNHIPTIDWNSSSFFIDGKNYFYLNNFELLIIVG